MFNFSPFCLYPEPRSWFAAKIPPDDTIRAVVQTTHCTSTFLYAASSDTKSIEVSSRERERELLTSLKSREECLAKLGSNCIEAVLIKHEPRFCYCIVRQKIITVSYLALIRDSLLAASCHTVLKQMSQNKAQTHVRCPQARVIMGPV